MRRMMAFAGSLLALYTNVAHAQLGTGAPIVVNTGVSSSVPTIVNGFINVLLSWSTLVATALFLLGSFVMVASGGEETLLANGKKICKASLIGLAIIVGSWMLMSTVVSFIA